MTPNILSKLKHLSWEGGKSGASGTGKATYLGRRKLGKFSRPPPSSAEGRKESLGWRLWAPKRRKRDVGTRKLSANCRELQGWGFRVLSPMVGWAFCWHSCFWVVPDPCKQPLPMLLLVTTVKTNWLANVDTGAIWAPFLGWVDLCVLLLPK